MCQYLGSGAACRRVRTSNVLGHSQPCADVVVSFLSAFLVFCYVLSVNNIVLSCFCFEFLAFTGANIRYLFRKSKL